jgi:hypothetical protein
LDKGSSNRSRSSDYDRRRDNEGQRRRHESAGTNERAGSGSGGKQSTNAGGSEPRFIVSLEGALPTPKSVLPAPAKRADDTKRAARDSHAERHGPLKPKVPKMAVSVQDGKRSVAAGRPSRRGDSSTEEEKPRKRGRKRDWCRLCKSEMCDHCFRFEGDTSSSDDD